QGQVFLGRDLGHERDYSEATAQKIDDEVQRIIREQYERTKDLLTKHVDELELVAQTLLKVETLDAAQIKQLIDNGRLDPDPTDHDLKVQIQPKKEEDDDE